MLDTKTKTQTSKCWPPLLVWIHISSDVWPLFSLASGTTQSKMDASFEQNNVSPCCLLCLLYTLEEDLDLLKLIGPTNSRNPKINSVPCVLAAQAKEFLKAAASTCIKSKPPKALTSGRKSWKTKGRFKKWCCFRSYRNSRITPSKITRANLISVFCPTYLLCFFYACVLHSCMFVVFFVLFPIALKSSWWSTQVWLVGCPLGRSWAQDQIAHGQWSVRHFVLLPGGYEATNWRKRQNALLLQQVGCEVWKHQHGLSWRSAIGKETVTTQQF